MDVRAAIPPVVPTAPVESGQVGTARSGFRPVYWAYAAATTPVNDERTQPPLSV